MLSFITVDTQIGTVDPVPYRPVKGEKTSLKAVRDADSDPSKPLTRKQQLFVEFYRRTGDEKRAAMAAGYSPFDVEHAKKIIKNPRIQKEINRLDLQWFKDLGLDNPDWLIERTARVASANLADYIDISDDGTFRVNLSKVDRNQLYAIESLSYDPEGRPKIGLETRSKAREMLLKLFLPKEGQESLQSGNKLTVQFLDSIVNILPKEAPKGHISALPPRLELEANAISSADIPVSVGDQIANKQLPLD